MEKSQNKKLKIVLVIMVIALGILFSLIRVLAANDDVEWHAATQGISWDAENKKFVVYSIDKPRTSAYYYQTVGFDVSDPDNPERSVRFSVEKEDLVSAETVTPVDSVRNKYERTIDYNTLVKLIQKSYPDWAEEIVSSDYAALQFDAILCIHMWLDLNGDGVYQDTVSCALDTVTGNIQFGRAYTKYGENYVAGDLEANWQLLGTAEHHPQLAALKPFVATHFNYVVYMNGKKPTVNPTPTPTPTPATNSDFVTTIGSLSKTEYSTYNYDPTGQFVLGDGIPTDEDVTNGYRAWSWFGGADICRKDNVSKTWTFKGTVSVTVHTKEPEVVYYDPKNPKKGFYIEYVDAEFNMSDIDVTVNVTRSVGYWYLGKDTVNGFGGANFYKLSTVTAKNNVFQGGTRNYSYSDSVDISVTCNGVDLASNSSYSMIADNNWHIDWASALVNSNETFNVGELHIDVDKDEKGAIHSLNTTAYNMVKAEAENRIKASSEIRVRNDELRVDGHTYMSSDWYQYKNFSKNFGAANTAYDINDGDHTVVGAESTGKIPATIANGDYATTVKATYTQASGTGRSTINKPYITSITSGNDKFGHSFQNDNEPITVHTPTVSAVEIIDPDTGNRYKLQDMPTQLTTGAYNSNVDYQLLLDGTYTLRFKPETHYEHIGYDASTLTDTLYNKYCAYREVAFPFAVQVNGKIYEPNDETYSKDTRRRKEKGYTDWITLPADASGNPSTEVDFYVPTWAVEDDTYVVLFRVAPQNVIDAYGVDHIDDTEYLKNENLYDYVSTYSINVQLSGIIYGFQAVGINDKDRFEGFKTQADGQKVTNGIGKSNFFAFCPTKQEKRSGTLNRLGGNSVRYTLDGTLTSNWDIDNTLPFAIGRSQSNASEGDLVKGNTFAFSVKTIANLGDEDALLDGTNTSGDCIIIKPSFRYISNDGTVTDDIDVYYNTSNGEEKLSFVQFGSSQDLSTRHTTSLSDTRFDGSYYYYSGKYEPSLRRIIYAAALEATDKNYNADNAKLWKYHADDAEFSAEKASEYWANLGYPENKYTTEAYLNRESENYCLSEIVLNSRLRLLSGNVQELAMNLSKEGDSLLYLKDKASNGNSYEITPDTNAELWEKHRKSMQTWYGTYWIPSQLFITDDKFEADADGDGVPETYDNIYEYAKEKGHISEDDPIFKETGYLVVNFEIYTRNNGEEHLVYNGSNADMWEIEGQPKTVTVGDGTAPGKPKITVDVRPGDVAVVDLDRSLSSRYYVGYNIIN